jgi:hypothetical protein
MISVFIFLSTVFLTMLFATLYENTHDKLKIKLNNKAEESSLNHPQG